MTEWRAPFFFHGPRDTSLRHADPRCTIFQFRSVLSDSDSGLIDVCVPRDTNQSVQFLGPATQWLRRDRSVEILILPKSDKISVEQCAEAFDFGTVLFHELSSYFWSHRCSSGYPP